MSLKNGQAEVSRYFKNIPGWKVEDKKFFWKDVLQFYSSIVLQRILDTDLVHCTAFTTADKNVNRLESRKLRTAPGCDAGSHVLRRPGVL